MPVYDEAWAVHGGKVCEADEHEGTPDGSPSLGQKGTVCVSGGGFV